jgi:Ca2+/Na+ antiporter
MTNEKLDISFGILILGGVIFLWFLPIDVTIRLITMIWFFLLYLLVVFIYPSYSEIKKLQKRLESLEKKVYGLK